MATATSRTKSVCDPSISPSGSVVKRGLTATGKKSVYIDRPLPFDPSNVLSEHLFGNVVQCLLQTCDWVRLWRKQGLLVHKPVPLLVVQYDDVG